MYENTSNPSYDSIPREIVTEITNSVCCVFFWSASASQRPWIRREFNIAHEIWIDFQEKGVTSPFIYIIRIDRTALAEEMRAIKWYDYSPQNIEEIYKAILNTDKSPQPISKPPLQNIKDFMTHNPISVLENDTFEHAFFIMESHGIRHLIVNDNTGKLSGFLSKRDILRALPPTSGITRLDHKRWRNVIQNIGNTPVSKIMTSFHELKLLQANDNIVQALELLINRVGFSGGDNHRISAIPILDENRIAVGILSYIDLICGLLGTLPDEPVQNCMIKRPEIHTVDLLAPLETCYNNMRNLGVRHLIVVDKDDYVLGIVDDNTILHLMHRDFQSDVISLPTRDFMVSIHYAQSLNGSEPIKEVAKIFCHSKNIGILILADNGKLIGLISYTEILKLSLEFLLNNGSGTN
jgi:CBS domain-containing protein